MLKPGFAQRLGQCIGIELRIVAGSRNGADIDEKIDLMGAQQADEFTDRSGRMADGPDCRLPRHGAVWHSEQGIATVGIGSIRRQFFGIDFEEPQSAVGDVFGLVEAIAQLHGRYKERGINDKGKVSR